MTFCLIPQVLNSVNMILSFYKICAVIDKKMTKFTHIQHIITAVIIRTNKGLP